MPHMLFRISFFNKVPGLVLLYIARLHEPTAYAKHYSAK